MSLHLITGYAGEAHITSNDQGAYNMATYGSGQFVVDRGEKFEASVLSNNSISIADGEAMMQGRFIKLPSGTTETVSIDNGSQGMFRNDLICIRYEKSSSTTVESVSFVVVKGTESESEAEDPEYTEGDITDGTDLVNEMPLYRVSLDGLNIDSVTPLFSVKPNMVDYMDNYQLQPATASVLGGVKKGSGIQIDGDGVASVKVNYFDRFSLSGDYTTSFSFPPGFSLHLFYADISQEDAHKYFGGKLVYAVTVSFTKNSNYLFSAPSVDFGTFSNRGSYYLSLQCFVFNNTSSTISESYTNIDAILHCLQP